MHVNLRHARHLPTRFPIHDIGKTAVLSLTQAHQLQNTGNAIKKEDLSSTFVVSNEGFSLFHFRSPLNHLISERIWPI